MGSVPVVLVEGRSDVAAVEVLARRRGLVPGTDLAAIDMGGVTNIRREWARHSTGLVLVLCDAAEAGFVRRVLADADMSTGTDIQAGASTDADGETRTGDAAANADADADTKANVHLRSQAAVGERTRSAADTDTDTDTDVGTSRGRSPAVCFVCDRDLEDELIRALEPDVAAAVVRSVGLGAALDTFRAQTAWRDRAPVDQLRRFAGAGSGRKELLARAWAGALLSERVPLPLRSLLDDVSQHLGRSTS